MALLDTSDTIAAIASSSGFGFRGIVRLSGPRAAAIALKGFTAASEPARRQARAIRVGGHLRVDGLRPELPASILIWKGIRSFTGQPSAEIHTVGSLPLLQLVLAHALTQGARLAERGEFTLRAFLSGRIDLTQAEAVLGVIDAASPFQVQAALEQLGGGLAGPVSSLRDHLLDILAHLEANLDFVDEPDVDPLGRLELTEILAQGSTELDRLATQLNSRDRPDGLPRVVLVGPPNAGKSRLFNALLGRPEAIVSPIAGTTRDYLSATLECDGVAVELIDTAGTEAAASAIEAAAQTLRDTQSAGADLRLDCRSVEMPSLGDQDIAISQTLRVVTKSDLFISHASLANAIPTSAATGEGLALLRQSIAAALRAQLSGGGSPTSTSARCRDGLFRSSNSLARASEGVRLSLGDELVSIDIREAVDELGKVVGAVVTDDVLDRIFQRFCIGK